MTRKYRTIWAILALLSVLANVVPLAYFTVAAYCEADVVYSKLAMTASLFAALLLTVVWLITKIQLRSRLWIVLIGIFLCLDYALVAIMVIAICQVVDELILAPLRKRYYNLYTINKEIDKR